MRFAISDFISAGFGKAFKLNIGGKAAFADGLSVTLKEINDSRCKPDMQCIWAGELSTLLSVTGGEFKKAIEEVRLGTTNNKSATKDNYSFTLQSATETTATLLVKTLSVGAGGSGVSGYVHVGPTCPVQQYPPDPNCADLPLVDGTVALSRSDSAIVVAQGRTDRTGHFTITVPAGSYKVTTSVGSPLPRCQETEAAVPVGDFTVIDISCDSGIR